MLVVLRQPSSAWDMAPPSKGVFSLSLWTAVTDVADVLSSVQIGGNGLRSTIIVEPLHSCPIIIHSDTWTCWLKMLVSSICNAISGSIYIIRFVGRSWRWIRTRFGSIRKPILSVKTIVTGITLHGFNRSCFGDFNVVVKHCSPNSVQIICCYGTVNRLRGRG